MLVDTKLENLADVMEWMASELPMYSQIGELAYKEGLYNISVFLDKLGNPQNRYKTLHIAGTNGKGSTSHMLASVLQEQGYKVGLFTSPHLKSFTERMRVNGKECNEQYILYFINKHYQTILDAQLSFFELTTAMAFDYFSEEAVDFGIIEVGLGGRLDATNVILPILSIITNIHYDHQNILGNTLSKIAFEKGGIIKESIPLVLGQMLDDPKQTLLSLAKQRNAKVFEYENQSEFSSEDFLLDLKGNYQKINVKTVLASLNVLKNELGIEVDSINIKKGLERVVLNTNLRGRWETISENPLLVCDTAHNIDGILQVVNQIYEQKYDQLHLVLGFVTNKDFEAIINLFPRDAIFYFCEPNLPRKLPLSEIQRKINQNLQVYYFHSVNEALNKAKQNATPNDFIFIGGSNFVVAEVIPKMPIQ
jgi:dihydrofolate synthase / folylpolyglutamate synthase